MWPDWVSNPGPLVLESDALPTALRGPAALVVASHLKILGSVCLTRFTGIQNKIYMVQKMGSNTLHSLDRIRLFKYCCGQCNLEQNWNRLPCGIKSLSQFPSVF